MRILPKQFQLLAVIAVPCAAGSSVVVNHSVKASGKGFHQALRDGHGPRHRAFDHRIARRRAGRYQCRGWRRMGTFPVADLC